MYVLLPFPPNKDDNTKSDQHQNDQRNNNSYNRKTSRITGEGVDFPIDAADGNTVGYTVDAFGVKFVAFVAAVLDEFHGYEVAVVVSPVVVFDVPVVAVSVLRVVVEYEIVDTVLDPLK